MSSVFSESGMGSCRVGLGMTGVDAGSGWDGVASGQGVEAEGPPVGGALGLVRVAKMVPVVLVPGPVPGAVRMGLPHILDYRTGQV